MLPFILIHPGRVLAHVQPGAQALIWRNQVVDYLIPEPDVRTAPMISLNVLPLGQSSWLDVGICRRAAYLVLVGNDSRYSLGQSRIVLTTSLSGLPVINCLTHDMFIEYAR
jgi:hypothetical protein